MAVEEVFAGKLVDRKSKFFAHLYKIENLDSDIEEIQKIHNKKYKKAAHHCYAALVNNQEDSRNDGEVGSPGRVLLELLQEYKLDGYMIMISRIFGGIKLGQGGVARAFRNTGRGVIESYINSQ
ncbi:YigZ family protein [Methanosphaera sp.]|uniref:YigZ family protein n=1 Tax=Methanosphaera sp. TaxID=2666342 RepID=UPI0025D2A48D|nr:YigZ family protein [Methanosphaera sp.]MEE1117020.1 YigZ family protein [Methanosphaera sp.]MEE3419133.1 YigZ family protein [Methanosphaera sp.]